jgi:hypothetical protein
LLLLPFLRQPLLRLLLIAHHIPFPLCQFLIDIPFFLNPTFAYQVFPFAFFLQQLFLMLQLFRLPLFD